MRFGLFGTGPWARMAHAPALAAHPRADLVGVWGRDGGKAAALAEEYGATAYGSAADLIADVQAVAVALPPDVQAQVALRAARAGRHLLLDKPVAFDTATADAIAGEVAVQGLASAVFFTSRFVPQIEEFLTRAAGRDGWHEARVDHLGSIFEPGNPFGASPWRRERGGLWDVGPHALSLVLPVLGAVVEVRAVEGPRATTHVLLRHAGGAVSTLTLSVDAAAGAARHEAVFFGEPGTAAVPSVPFAPQEALALAVDALLDAADGGAPVGCDVRFGAQVVAVLAAAEESVRDGRTVTL